MNFLKFIPFFKLKSKPNKGFFCTCSTQQIDSQDFVILHAYLINDKHTGTMLYRCKTCDGFFGFPHHNLELMIRKGTIETHRKLIKLGFDKLFIEEYILKNI